MTIEITNAAQLAAVVSGLVQEGLTFHAEIADGGWLITLTGGF